MIEFAVPGTPIGKGRPRFRRVKTFVQTYTPKKTADYESLVRQQAQNEMMGRQPLEMAVRAEITARYEPPASWSKKKRLEAVSGLWHPTTKPDIDNAAKAILDALNGVCYLDDKQVVQLLVIKEYGENARSIIRIMPLG
jgi:Holliday junction resolvase RusA-like endonuclease